MFKFMFLFPHQIMLKTNELGVKMDWTKMNYFSNTRIKVRGPIASYFYVFY